MPALFSPEFQSVLRWLRSSAQGRTNTDVVRLANPNSSLELAAVVQLLAERMDDNRALATTAVANMPTDDRIHLTSTPPVLTANYASGFTVAAANGSALSLAPDTQWVNMNALGLYLVQASVNFSGILTPTVNISIDVQGGVDPQVGRGIFQVYGGLLLAIGRGAAATWMVRCLSLPAAFSVVVAQSGATISAIGVDAYKVT